MEQKKFNNILFMKLLDEINKKKKKDKSNSYDYYLFYYYIYVFFIKINFSCKLQDAAAVFALQDEKHGPQWYALGAKHALGRCRDDQRRLKRWGAKAVRA